LYDFVAQASGAAWESGIRAKQDTTPIPFNGPAGQQGCVKYENDAILNDGSTVAQVLEARPLLVQDGFIRGCYDVTSITPSASGYKIQPGDHLTGRFGFLNNTPDAVATFDILFAFMNGNNYNTELHYGHTYTDGVQPFNIDLYEIVQSHGAIYNAPVGDICLVVYTGEPGQPPNPNADQDKGIWVDTKVTR
jgi:hypothetical protein